MVVHDNGKHDLFATTEFMLSVLLCHCGLNVGRLGKCIWQRHQILLVRIQVRDLFVENSLTQKQM